MQEKIRLKQIFYLSNILLSVLLFSFGISTSFVAAQQYNNISDKAYKDEVLQQIAGLLETKYVDPEMAKRYAEDFKKKFESGVYESYTNPKEFAEKVTAVMRMLSNANAIIIDLRENGGGSGDYLSSYFLEHPTQLNSWYSREDDYLTEFWTFKEIGVERLTDVPLFLLTSERTFSAAESFAYDMKVRERATLIGDATKGGAHSVDLFKIDDQFEIYISTVRAINPVTGENWEGTGVIPDVQVPSESALDTAIVLAKKAGAEYAKAKEGKLKLAVEEMQILIDQAEILYRKNKKDEAGTVLDSFFQIAEKHNLSNEFFMDVLAYNYYSEKDEQILYAILKKKIEFFPKSPTAYAALGYAYFKYNKNELAIANFEKVLEFDPDNRNAARMIERMR